MADSEYKQSESKDDKRKRGPNDIADCIELFRFIMFVTFCACAFYAGILTAGIMRYEPTVVAKDPICDEQSTWTNYTRDTNGPEYHDRYDYQGPKGTNEDQKQYGTLRTELFGVDITTSTIKGATGRDSLTIWLNFNPGNALAELGLRKYSISLDFGCDEDLMSCRYDFVMYDWIH
jgi:hypothetical protein